MKPIRLRFSGLHSYRTTQDIDFVELSQGGLFGIFGPTGSGKSTILDAMTLALYARVDRAGGTRQGILNDNEDSLFVDFTFELGTDDDRRRYQVERRYKRSGPHSVHVTHARLVDLTSDTVLADKDSDVTEQVEALLGLTHDDFTRAVVLPQGKFAQFLLMKGSERRHMLERLFSLEDYGQRLLRRIAARRARVENELHKVTGQQQILGDASKERVEALRAAVAEAAQRVEETERAWQAVQQEYDEAKARRDRQHELSDIEAQLAAVQEAQAAIDALRRELALAEAAEPIRRDLLAVAEAEQLLRGAEHRLAAAEGRLRASVLQDEEAEDAYERARSVRQQEEPALLTRLGLLQEALEHEKTLDDLRQQTAALEKRKRDQEQILDAVLSEEQTLKALLVEKEKMLDQKRTQERQTAVTPEHRRKVSQAASALDRFENAARDVEARSKELTTIKKALDEVARRHEQAKHTAEHERKQLESIAKDLARLEDSPPTDDATLAANVAFIERVRSQIRQIEELSETAEQAQRSLHEVQLQQQSAREELEQAAREVSAAEERLAAEQRRLETVRAERQQAELSQLATTLAAALVPNEPCPVCGSTHHPRPATQAEHDAAGQETLTAAEQAVRRAEEAVVAAKQREAVAAVQLRNAEARVAEQNRMAEQAKERLAAAYLGLPGPWQKLTLAEILQEFAAEERNHRERQKSADAWKQQISALRRRLAEQQTSADRAALELSELAAELARHSAEYENCERALAQAKQSLDAAAEAFRSAAGDWDTERVRIETAAVEEADERSERLRREIADLDAEVQDLRTRITPLETKRSELVAALATINSELRALSREAVRLTETLQRMTAGRSAADLLKEVETRLSELGAAEESTLQRREKTRKERQQAEQEAAVARETLEQAKQQAAAAHSKLAEHLARSGFSSAEEAAAALRPDDRRRHMQEQIEEHLRALDHLRQRRDALRRELGETWIDDAAWDDVQQRLQQADRAREAAIRAHSAAQHELDTVTDRHNQWIELENQRVEIQTTKDHLDQLTSLFRGNRFVEFVSEEYLAEVARVASVHLGELTRHRYALEVDSGSGFIIRDDSNGGIRRPVSSLSGGETFVTSLALALALSQQIQLHGTYPLEFFFLDEGFGTLDAELLDTVMTCLERLQSKKITIGIISHVPELRQRISHRLIVHPPRTGDMGSYLVFERG